MAIKFQYNKTSLQSLDKQLKMRVRALPTIKNKESALRLEVKKAKEVADEFDGKLDDTLNGISDMLQLYDEYTPDILTVKDVNMSVKKIAGVRTYCEGPLLFPAPLNQTICITIDIDYTGTLKSKTFTLKNITLERNKMYLFTLWILNEHINISISPDAELNLEELKFNSQVAGNDGFWN